ncbi:hypothetical protein HKD37_07G017746 [Glycine soja]
MMLPASLGQLIECHRSSSHHCPPLRETQQLLPHQGLSWSPGYCAIHTTTNLSPVILALPFIISGSSFSRDC